MQRGAMNMERFSEPNQSEEKQQTWTKQRKKEEKWRNFEK